MKEKLWKKNFTLVVIGQIISLFGNAILRFALPLYLFDQTKSAAILGFVSASSFLPMILLSPIGGIVADRVNKQKIMVVLDFTTAIVVFLFSMIRGTVPLIPTLVSVLMILYGIQGAYQPTVQASVPLLVSEKNLLSGNAIINQVSALASLLGPVIGGFFYGRYGIAIILVVSCICFLFSAIMELFIRIPFQKQKNQESVLALVKSDMSKSLHYIFHEKRILSKVIGLISLFNLFMTSMLMIGLQVIMRQTLSVSSELYGASQGALAIGGLVGGVLVGVLGNKLSIKKSYLLLAAAAIFCIPMGIVLLFELSTFMCYLIITMMSFLLMLVSTMFSIQMLSFVQMETPVELVGKVISCLLAFSMCAQPIGQSLYGMLFESFADKPWIIIFGAAAISLGIALMSKSTFKRLE